MTQTSEQMMEIYNQHALFLGDFTEKKHFYQFLKLLRDADNQSTFGAVTEQLETFLEEGSFPVVFPTSPTQDWTSSFNRLSSGLTNIGISSSEKNEKLFSSMLLRYKQDGNVQNIDLAWYYKEHARQAHAQLLIVGCIIDNEARFAFFCDDLSVSEEDMDAGSFYTYVKELAEKAKQM